MFAFEHGYLLFLLILIPLWTGLYMLLWFRRRKLWAKLGDERLLLQLVPDYSAYRQHVKFSLMMLALAFIIMGLANLRIGSKLQKSKRKGVDIMIALDVSNSMLAQDIKPSRLARAQMAVSKLIDGFEDDQIGIIAFAGRARVLLPVTIDYAAAKSQVEAVSPDFIPQQGTAIGEAIAMADSAFSKKSRNNKAIIVISDGENHEDDAVAAAASSAGSGIPVYTVGMGSQAGAPIPVAEEQNGVVYKKDGNGNTIVTKMNEKMLQDVALAGKGSYAGAGSADAALGKIFDEVSKIGRKEYEALEFAEFHSTYMYFMLAALLTLFAEALIFGRKTRLTRNWTVFGKKSYFETLAHEKTKK